MEDENFGHGVAYHEGFLFEGARGSAPTVGGTTEPNHASCPLIPKRDRYCPGHNTGNVDLDWRKFRAAELGASGRDRHSTLPGTSTLNRANIRALVRP